MPNFGQQAVAPSPEPAASAFDRRRSSSDEGAADVVAELADLGLSNSAAWYASAVLYGVGGSLIVALFAINHQVFPVGVAYLGVFAIVVCFLQLLGARRYSTSELATHLRLGVGIAIYTTGAYLAQDAAIALSLLPMLTVPNSCYLYGWRFALPYSVAATMVVLVAMLYVDGPARVAQAVIGTFAIAAIAVAVIFSKQRTRTLARRNRRLAYIDPLTGIANTRCLHDRIAAELMRPPDSARPFALFAMDLDDFKQVNDRFDHSRGDSVLRAVAAAVEEELESCDLAARRGGDELSAFVPDARGRDLDELRGRLESAIARARMATCPEVSPSGSVAYVIGRSGEELGAVMERADAALHDVKLESRNRRGAVARDIRRPQAPVVRPIESAAGSGAKRRVEPGEGDDVGENGTAMIRRGINAIVAFLKHSEVAWISTATMFGPMALILAAVSLSGMVQPLTPAEGGAIAAAFAVLTAACFWAAKKRPPGKLLHVAMIAAFGLVAAAVALAGPAGAALLDFLPILILFGFLLFRARTALLYMIFGQTLFGYFMISGHFAGGVARVATTIGITAVVGGLVSKFRLVTVRFARTNRELSERDGLTGVANMRALMQRIENVADRASSRKSHPMLLAIDLDEFKLVNDTYSHSIGDRVLIAVSRAISESVRGEDLVARRGGDEFVVVMNDAEADEAEDAARRIREAIYRVRTRLCPDLRPTASVAIVTWSKGESPAELLHDADLALHEAKSKTYGLDRLDATA